MIKLPDFWRFSWGNKDLKTLARLVREAHLGEYGSLWEIEAYTSLPTTEPPPALTAKLGTAKKRSRYEPDPSIERRLTWRTPLQPVASTSYALTAAILAVLKAAQHLSIKYFIRKKQQRRKLQGSGRVGVSSDKDKDNDEDNNLPKPPYLVGAAKFLYKHAIVVNPSTNRELQLRPNLGQALFNVTMHYNEVGLVAPKLALLNMKLRHKKFRELVSNNLPTVPLVLPANLDQPRVDNVKQNLDQLNNVRLGAVGNAVLKRDGYNPAPCLWQTPAPKGLLFRDLQKFNSTLVYHKSDLASNKYLSNQCLRISHPQYNSAVSRHPLCRPPSAWISKVLPDTFGPTTR